MTLGKAESEGGGPINPPVQAGIVSWGINGCQDDNFPSVFTRVSEVADWVTSTVCARTGELCKGSKAAKNSKFSKDYPSNCSKMPTDAPTITAQPTTAWPTWNPTITAQPITPYPSWMWPTWVPTQGMFPIHS